MRKIDLTGKQFGRLTVIRESHVSGKQIYWSCQCDCGNRCTVRGAHLRHEKILSCGCNRVVHGKVHDPEYKVWQTMIERCNNPNHDSYERYGGRGIRVCDRWMNSFAAFYEDMGPRPSEKHQVDREDNNGNYEPCNCHWTTIKQNSFNRSTSKRWYIKGAMFMSSTEAANAHGVTPRTILNWCISRNDCYSERVYS